MEHLVAREQIWYLVFVQECSVHKVQFDALVKVN